MFYSSITISELPNGNHYTFNADHNGRQNERTLVAQIYLSVVSHKKNVISYLPTHK